MPDEKESMRMKLILVRSVTVAAALLMIFSMFDTANAQRRREVRGRALNKAQVRAIIERVEDRVDNFVKNFDRSLDRSRLDGTSREDWLNKRSRDLEAATDELSREFDRRDTWAENREEVRRCLNIASDIDRNMLTYRYGTVTESNWSRVRFELNSLADVYNMPGVGAAAYR
jgi:septal ring factor EnvC (AmiA/AmiB activator)